MERVDKKPKDPDARMGQMRKFLTMCGDPQRGIPAVHVGGTSGKGSVSAHIAGLLQSSGLSVGLHISPYLQSATEKIWVDGAFASSDEFADLVEWVMPIARPLVNPRTPASIHGMASVAVALEYFRKRNVDVMVFEVGCGGRYDLTSFVETCVAVVTNVAMDHVVSLGPTLEDIAHHKAGIARAGVPLVTGASGSAFDVIEEETRRVGCPLIHIPPSKTSPRRHNRELALAATRAACEALNHPFERVDTQGGIEAVKLPGRCETIRFQDRIVVLDGAHNPEKLGVALDDALMRHKDAPRKVALVGFLGSKAKSEVTAPFAERFDEFVVTEPRVYGKSAFPSEQTAALFADLGYAPYSVLDPREALDLALKLAGPGGLVVATGSFYLVGELRDTFFPKHKVVMQRTSWPR